MKDLGKKRPFIFQVILFAIGMMMALAFSVLISRASFSNDVKMSFGKLLSGLVIFIIFREAATGGKPFSGVKLFPAALLFVIWNIVHNLVNGATMIDRGFSIAFILAIGSAIFEEVIFRGIFISNLRARGYDDITTLIMSSAFFGGAHAYNLSGADLKTTAIQVFYTTVIGLVLGAIYIRTRDIMSVILLHFLIDFSGEIYATSPTGSGVAQHIIFGVLLVIECAYSFYLIRRIDRDFFAEADD